MSQQSTQELVLVRLTRSWTMAGGGVYNPGERAAFSRAVADDIVSRGCGYEDPLTAPTTGRTQDKALSSPVQDKMLQAPAKRKREVLRGES